MATSVYFNGKMRTLPGVYSTITSGDTSATRNLDYGVALLIDTGKYGSGFGGGSGIKGVRAQGRDAIYEFTDLPTFRDFVKGGMYWKCAEALFNPDPYNADAVGISKLLFVRAAKTEPATMVWAPKGQNLSEEDSPLQYGRLVIKTLDEGTCANGELEPDIKYTDINGVERVYDHLYSGYAFTIEAVEDSTLLTRTVSVADGDGEDESTEVDIVPTTKYVMKIWRGTYTGEYNVGKYQDGQPYNELSKVLSDPELICQSDPFITMNELIQWCQTSSNFASRFYLSEIVDAPTQTVSAKKTRNTTIIDENATVKSGAYMVLSEEEAPKSPEHYTYHCAANGSQDYANGAYVDAVLEQISDVDYNIVFTDCIEDDALKAVNRKVIAHRNNQAKFDKFVYIGTYGENADFAKSVNVAQSLNSAWVVAVHGGIGTVTDSAEIGSGVRYWGIFYNLCQVIGRVGGKPPYTPITNKTIGGDRLQHIPSESQKEKAVNAGLVVVYPNPYIQRFVILQGVTTLQDNKVLFNRKGESFSIQFMRCVAQLNKECVVNAEIDLMADENGVTTTSLSKGVLENWTVNFLNSRLASPTQDNLIAGFRNVTATKVDDYYKVTYEIIINNEITKVFFTGFLLRN